MHHFFHHKNIQSLAIKIYQFLLNVSPCIMNNIFKVNEIDPNALRKRNVLQTTNPSSIRYGTATISYMAPKIWTLVPKTIKNCDSLKSFKQKIRKWKSDCPCRLFATCWFCLTIRYLVLLLSLLLGSLLTDT